MKNNIKNFFSFDIKGKEKGLCIYIIILILLFSFGDKIFKKSDNKLVKIVIDGEWNNSKTVKYYEQVLNNKKDILRVFIDSHGSYSAKVFNYKNELISSQDYYENGMLKVLGTNINFNIYDGDFISDDVKKGR